MEKPIQMNKFIWTTILLLSRGVAQARSHSSRVTEVKGVLSELPDTGEEWVSLTPEIEFQPAAPSQDDDESFMEYVLRGATERFLVGSFGSHSGYENQFIDGAGTYYNDYAQAWRLLGFYTDCNAPRNNYNECYDDDYDGNDNNGGGSGSDDDEEEACQRYLLWAAYVDLDYSGGGIGEYQFYDREKERWDATACRENNGRCARMDCHLKDTNFKLLGFFKEPNYHEWMEQLFKHQGVCLWTNNEYYFMDTERQLWPCDCTNTGREDEQGNALYYDSKPMPEGRIGLGLYTDSRCRYDYTGRYDIMDVLDGDVSEIQRNLHKWNDAFDVFKICQPCKAYNLGYNYNDQNQGEGADREDEDEGDGDDDGDAPFTCYDDAGYTNVNQCMKFKTKTEMIVGDFRDIMLAHQQGNIVEFELMGTTYGYGGFRTGEMKADFTMSGVPDLGLPLLGFFFGSLVFMVVSASIFSRMKCKTEAANLKESLMDNDNFCCS